MLPDKLTVVAACFSDDVVIAPVVVKPILMDENHNYWIEDDSLDESLGRIWRCEPESWFIENLTNGHFIVTPKFEYQPGHQLTIWYSDDITFEYRSKESTQNLLRNRARKALFQAEKIVYNYRQIDELLINASRAEDTRLAARLVMYQVWKEDNEPDVCMQSLINYITSHSRKECSDAAQILPSLLRAMARQTIKDLIG